MEKRPVILVVMDGIGIREDKKNNAVALANKPTLDKLWAECPHTQLRAHGLAVGLPTDSDMGNSEVGHNALGCGQIYSQGAKLVNENIESKEIFNSKTWKDLAENAKDSKMHFIGLLSDGNVHSNISHLKALIKEAKNEGIKEVRIHALLDGRDVPATSALEYVSDIESFMAELNDDMCTLNPDTYEEALLNKDDDGHGFHEASSLRKVGDHYVIVYASEFIDETHRNGGHPTNLDYAVSKSVAGPYVRKGRIIDNTGIDPQSWNNHGSIVKIENQWYVFYHGSSNNTKYARRARVERIEVDEERGIIEQVEMTSQGFSHGLDATAGIEAGWQCGLTGGAYLTEKEGRFPLVHITDGCSVKWRYIEFLEDANWAIEIEGTALKECGISILANGESVGVINIEDIHQETTWKAPIELNKSGRYEIELQFFAEGEEDLFELDRIRFVKNKIN